MSLRRPTMDSYDYEEYDGEVPRFWFSSRFAMALLGFIGFLSMSSQRMCITVALVCMLNQTAMTGTDFKPLPLQPTPTPTPSAIVAVPPINGSVDVVVAGDNDTAAARHRVAATPPPEKACGEIPEIFVLNTSDFSRVNRGEFTWPKTTQRAILDSFHWGYMLTQVPSGWLAQRFGGKRVFGFMMLTSSLSTVLVPIAARTHLFLLLSLRFIAGIGSGATFPAMHTLWGKWAPPQERSLLASISYAGSLTGSVGIFLIAELLCEYGLDGKGFDGGWPAIFYIFGALGVVWFVLWMVCASESPSQHGRINTAERQYIIDTLMTEAVTSHQTGKMFKVPWSKMMTSFPFIAIVLCNFTYEWGIYTFETFFPDFQKNILKLDIKLNTIFALLPYLGLWVIVMASGGSADRLQSHGVLSTTATRKIMQLIGAIVPAAMVAANGFIDCTQWPGAISFMTVGLSFCGFQYNGFLVNHLDLAPPFAGLLMGIGNAIGTTARFWQQYFHGVIMSTSEDVRVQWQTVFLITAAFYLSSTTFYVLCGSGKLQWWALGGSQQVPVRADGLSPPVRSSDVGSRPHSAVFRQLSSPSSVFTSKPSAGASEPPYSGDSLRRAADLATESARGAPNHLSPSGDDSDALDRKLSSKSTSSSKTRDDATTTPAPVGAGAAARRTDHDRDHQPRVRRDQNLSAKQRHAKLSPSKSLTTTAATTTMATPAQPASPDEELRIYESLSESPV